MIALKKVTMIIGLGIALTVFGMFLFTFLPHMIYNNGWDNRYNQYDQQMDLSEEEIMEKFTTHPAYLAFYEKYPDGKEELKIESNHAELELGVANFDTNSYLKVHFNLYSHNNYTTNVNAYCQTDDPHMESRQNKHADGMFVEGFIAVTECVN